MEVEFPQQGCGIRWSKVHGKKRVRNDQGGRVAQSKNTTTEYKHSDETAELKEYKESVQ